MVSITSLQLISWVTAFIWPLIRILGLIATAPVFGNSAIPVSIKIGFGVVLAALVAPTLTNLPVLDPLSLPAMLIVMEQFIIGAAMGFTMQIMFSSVEMAGSLIANAMGLGFATFFDPLSKGTTSSISQFLTLLATMLFISMDLHLALLRTLIESFTQLPIGAGLDSQHHAGMWSHIVMSGSVIFSSGVQLALPIIASLLITNLALGILTKAAPQLNIFGIGFPITMSVGFIMVMIILPYLKDPMQHVIELGVQSAALR